MSARVAAAAVGLSMLLIGCQYFVTQPPQQPARLPGDLWIDVTNRSARDVEIGTEGQSGGSASGSGGVVGGCQALRMGGGMEQTWRILVDGEVVLDSAELPAGVPGAGRVDVVLPIEIRPDGEVIVGEPRPAPDAASGDGRALPGRGEPSPTR